MVTFKEFTDNKKIILELHPSDFAQGFIKTLNKYKKQKNVYVRYSMAPTDFSTKSTPGSKAGQAWHADPIGVYAFPTNYIANNPTKSRIFQDHPYLNFIEDNSKNKIVIQRDWMFTDFPLAVDYLSEVFPHKPSARRLMNRYLMKNRDARVKINILFARAIFYGLQYEYDSENYPKLLSGPQQTKIFIDAGIDAIEDLGRKPHESVIMPEGGEPQIIFLKRDSYKILETITNPQINALDKNSLEDKFKRIAFEISNSSGLKILNKKYDIETQRGTIIFENGVYTALSFTPFAGGYNNKKIKLDEIKTEILILSPYEYEFEKSYQPKTRIAKISKDFANWWNSNKDKKISGNFKYWKPEDI